MNILHPTISCTSFQDITTSTVIWFLKISDFTLTGHGINQSFIVCPSPARVVVTNVDDFVFQNISLIGCMTLSETDASSKNYYYVSVFLYHCGSVVLHN